MAGRRGWWWFHLLNLLRLLDNLRFRLLNLLFSLCFWLFSDRLGLDGGLGLGFILRLALRLLDFANCGFLLRYNLTFIYFLLLLSSLILRLREFLLHRLLQNFACGFFGSLGSGYRIFAFILNFCKFILHQLWFLFHHARLELNALILGSRFHHIRRFALLLWWYFCDIRHFSGALHFKTFIFLNLNGMGSRVLSIKVLIAVKAGVLGGFRQNKWVVFERNWLYHIYR